MLTPHTGVIVCHKLLCFLAFEEEKIMYALCVLFINFVKCKRMKVHLVKKETIEDYAKDNAGCRSSFELWLTKLKKADWNNPTDILASYPSADLLGNGTNRVIFDIGGNLYRMICRYAFGRIEVRLFICWIGTHAEYTKLCNNKQQYTVRKY